MVEKYNNTYHRSTKLKPTDARKPANYKHINNALSAEVNARKATLPKFHVGDKVRIVRKKGTFEKGFTPNWAEVFTIAVKATKPPTYTMVSRQFTADNSPQTILRRQFTVRQFTVSQFTDGQLTV